MTVRPTTPRRDTRPGPRLPLQSPPVSRDGVAPAHPDGRSGVAAAQSACSHLTGLARQMCYSSVYDVSI